MRNTSDIFCLKEPKIGENDGSQIFSVKGSSFSRINRRQTTTSDVFQYGRPNTSDHVHKATKSPEDIQVSEEKPEEEAAGEPVSKSEDDAKNKEIVTNKAAGEPVVTVSSIKRNPLTGTGVEDTDTYTSRRRRSKDQGKWLW